MQNTTETLALRELLASLNAYPVCSAETAALRAFAAERIRSVLALPTAPGAALCARCRRVELARVAEQAVLN